MNAQTHTRTHILRHGKAQTAVEDNEELEDFEMYSC